MLIPSVIAVVFVFAASLSRRVNANSQQPIRAGAAELKLIKKGEC